MVGKERVKQPSPYCVSQPSIVPSKMTIYKMVPVRLHYAHLCAINGLVLVKQACENMFTSIVQLKYKHCFVSKTVKKAILKLFCLRQKHKIQYGCTFLGTVIYAESFMLTFCLEWGKKTTNKQRQTTCVNCKLIRNNTHEIRYVVQPMQD